MKLEGLDDEQLRRPMAPSGTNLLGLVKHLAGAEYQWFGQTFGRQTEPLETDPVADMNAGPDETTDGIIGFYRRACAAAVQVIDELDLDDQGTAWFGEQVPLRRDLVGMIEEPPGTPATPTSSASSSTAPPEPTPRLSPF